MLKIKMSNGKILIGLDKENIKRLTSGQPIKVKASDLGLQNDIFIAYGEKLQDILDELNIPGVQ